MLFQNYQIYYYQVFENSPVQIGGNGNVIAIIKLLYTQISILQMNALMILKLLIVTNNISTDRVMLFVM